MVYFTINPETGRNVFTGGSNYEKLTSKYYTGIDGRLLDSLKPYIAMHSKERKSIEGRTNIPDLKTERRSSSLQRLWIFIIWSMDGII